MFTKSQVCNAETRNIFVRFVKYYENKLFFSIKKCEINPRLSSVYFLFFI